MKYRLAALVCVLVLSISAFAQTPTPENPDPATREQVVKMMELLGVKRNMDLMIKGFTDSLKQGIWAGVKEKQPDVPEAMVNELNSVFDQMFSSFKADELVELMIPLYQKHMTKSEVDAAIRFYSSPEGSSFLKKMPAMMTEGMQVGQKYGLGIAQRAMPDLDKRVAEIVKKYSDPANQTSLQIQKNPSASPH